MDYLQTGNLTFFRLNSLNGLSNKYMAGTLYGGLFLDQIYTLEEIKAKYPNVKEITLEAKEIKQS